MIAFGFWMRFVCLVTGWPHRLGFDINREQPWVNGKKKAPVVSLPISYRTDKRAREREREM
jgi:hypothetical protein